MATEIEVVQIQLRQGLMADLTAATDLIPGEPLYATDGPGIGVVLKDGTTILWLTTAAAGTNQAMLANEKGAVNGVPTLNADKKVVQNPASTGKAGGIMGLPETLPALNAILKMAADGKPAEAEFADFAIGIQSGSNGNGSYIKFPDGTMFEWGTISRANGWVQSGSGYVYTLTYPVAFVGAMPTCIPITQSDYGTLPSTILNHTELNYATIRTDSGLATDSVHWEAKGRWK